MKRRTLCLLLTALLLGLCGCTAGTDAPTAQTTDAAQVEEASMAAEQISEYRQQQAVGLADEQTVQNVDGVQVVSGKVVRVGGGMEYTPAAASGYFAINGKLAENSEIAFSINPVSVLRYTLSLNADEDKTVKAGIRAYKQGEQLVSYEQEALQLTAGENTVDACIDTGENRPCSGAYSLRFYIDDYLVSETVYEV